MSEHAAPDLLERTLGSDTLVAYLVDADERTVGGPVLAGVSGNGFTLPNPIRSRSEGMVTIRIYSRDGAIWDSAEPLQVAAGSAVSMAR